MHSAVDATEAVAQPRRRTGPGAPADPPARAADAFDDRTTV
ncbi:hypothetical protein [Kitasatospora phosalacinea]|nr:hypothetical protein [Kitasatospora phosalacinea]